MNLFNDRDRLLTFSSVTWTLIFLLKRFKPISLYSTETYILSFKLLRYFHLIPTGRSDPVVRSKDQIPILS